MGENTMISDKKFQEVFDDITMNGLSNAELVNKHGKRVMDSYLARVNKATGYTPFNLTDPVTQDEARQQAIDWQNWASEQSLSYGELAEYQSYFATLANKFNLTEEFQENGII